MNLEREEILFTNLNIEYYETCTWVAKKRQSAGKSPSIVKFCHVGVITVMGVRRGIVFYVGRVTRLGRGVTLWVCGSGADFVLVDHVTFTFSRYPNDVCEFLPC